MRLTASLLLSVVSALFTLPALSATPGNVVVDIPGDITCSTVAHEPGFDVSTWKIGGTDPNTTTPTNPGKPQLENLVLTRIVDSCSEQLIRSFVSGKIIRSLTLTQYDSVGSGPVYAALTVTLAGSRIDSYSVSGATAVRPLETVNIVYSQACIATIAQSSTGALQPAQKVCYDARRNIVF